MVKPVEEAQLTFDSSWSIRHTQRRPLMEYVVAIMSSVSASVYHRFSPPGSGCTMKPTFMRQTTYELPS